METRQSEAKVRSSVRKSEAEYVDKKFQIEGLVRLVLSNSTQKAIGCLVGEDITANDNWILIPKQKITDHIAQHRSHSEFFPHKKKIIKYPEKQMFIGFVKPVGDDKQLFYFCLSIDAKNTVLKILEQDKIELRARLLGMVYKVAKPWTTHGSETEIEDAVIKNFRPLMEIEVESKYPLYTEKKKFGPRLVNDAPDGYIEILPSRFPYTNVLKKRVDTGTQVTPSVIEKEAQTVPVYPKNIYTQYKYEYTVPKLNRFHYEHLNKFLHDQVESLGDTIHVNENINLYTNEYMKIAKPVVHCAIVINRDLISFRDVLTCKDKSVSDIELHPLISNILVTSYCRSSFNKMNTSPVKEDDVSATTFGKHVALIWCHAESLKPRLFLYADREITSLRYCPFKPHILVGGCSNGQVVIWDLHGRLEKVETREILSPMELKHKMIMQSLMTWMKNTSDISVVYPTCVSLLDASHNAPIIKILWMLPPYKVTKNGKVELCSSDEPSFQFITAGMDGKVLIWDLQPIPITIDQEKKKPQKAPRPSALTADVSEVKSLDNILAPIYKINLKNKTTSVSYPITTLFCKSIHLGFSFEPMSLDAIDDCIERTYYKLMDSEVVQEFSPHFAVGDTLGNLFQCTFEGHEFDQGQKLNHENCQYIQFNNIHDGPIRSLYPNRGNRNIVLTVGGRVFAIWDVTTPPEPLFYRKSKQRYVAGAWSSQQLGAVVVARADSYLETWELLFRTKSPGRIIRLTGNVVIDLYSDVTRDHRSKNTFITTDVVGAVRLYKLSKADRQWNQAEQLYYGNLLRNRIINRRQKIKLWIESYKNKYLKKPEAEEEPTDTAPIPKKEENAPAEEVKKKNVIDKLKPVSGNTWAEKQEKIMYRILLEQKNLNLAEIEKNKIPLKKLYEEQQHKGKKTAEMLAKKEDIFDTAKKRLFKATEVKKRKKISVSFPPEIEQTMKGTFIDNYTKILDETLNYIKNNEFRYVFDWGAMMAQGTERKRCSNPMFQSHTRNRVTKRTTISFREDKDICPLDPTEDYDEEP